MKILGIRNSPTEVRFAICEKQDEIIVIINKDSENRLVFPRNINTLSEKIGWLYDELNNIISNNQDIAIIAIKQNENVSTNYTRLQETLSYDAITHLIGSQNGIPVNSYVYNSIGTNSKKVLEFAEQKTGKTSGLWNRKMADAVSAAVKEIENKS